LQRCTSANIAGQNSPQKINKCSSTERNATAVHVLFRAFVDSKEFRKNRAYHPAKVIRFIGPELDGTRFSCNSKYFEREIPTFADSRRQAEKRFDICHVLL